MAYKQFQNFFSGKVFLIGLTFVDNDRKLIEQFQTHGIVSELTSDGLLKLERNDNSIFQMPFDENAIKKAEKGEYKLRATNEIIIDPDYMMTWEIITTEEDNLEEIKMFGFLPPLE
jgi:hypothetical protein